MNFVVVLTYLTQDAISSFKIISESGVAAGVRRIEALTSTGLMKHYEAI